MSALQKIGIAAGILLLLIAGTAGITYWQVMRSLAARERALQEREQAIEANVAEQHKIIQDARIEADRARALERKWKQEADRLLKERAMLLQAAAAAGQARERVRDEVSRVPQTEIRHRIRRGLAALRPGPARPGG